ncbi:V-type ATP synthase subunit E [Halorientalis brevis]|uniref:A-type ATP synthase subunit E n=1 Tax=Halorientalis brevis TaxID=1126241 RepID=A0ABD6C921_9EURY|nr:V-type ATP synthase subunit E [Halorientalis brevis]
MSLETVVEDIRDEARARAEDIKADAEEKADAIIAEAEQDAEEIRAEREAEVESTIEQEREQRISSAKLEAKQARLEARRTVLGDVRESVESAVADIDGDQREELTRELLAAAVDEFDDDATLDVYGQPEDEELIESLLEELNHDGSYAGEYDCLGGVVVESEGSRIRVNNTFDSILEDVWEQNLGTISDKLFDQ